MNASRHVGRFAPSPTGPLHFGSLVAALGSHAAARAADGTWHLRIDDLDQDREAPDAVATIQHQLEAHGLVWDGPVLYQGTQGERYAAALARLRAASAVYPCTCSRRVVATG
ncbi:MAG: glutamate--tRNA ligase family protein, partial [Halofilum sp. (in: g-proteobacteria)]